MLYQLKADKYMFVISLPMTRKLFKSEWYDGTFIDSDGGYIIMNPRGNVFGSTGDGYIPVNFFYFKVNHGKEIIGVTQQHYVALDSFDADHSVATFIANFKFYFKKQLKGTDDAWIKVKPTKIAPE